MLQTNIKISNAFDRQSEVIGESVDEIELIHQDTTEVMTDLGTNKTGSSELTQYKQFKIERTQKLKLIDNAHNK